MDNPSQNILKPQNQVKNNINQQKQQKLHIYVYGSCESDQYVHPNDDSQSKRPICLNKFFTQKIYKIACGALHSICLTTEGKVFTFGCNDEGALGRPGQQKIPTLVEIQDPIDLISAGDNHSLFANSIIGSVYFTGSYKYKRGQSISSQKTLIPKKQMIKDIDQRNKGHIIKKIQSGNNHSAILVNGKIFVRGQPQSNTTGRKINARHKIENSLKFEGIGLNNVQDFWCGGYHSLAKVKKTNGIQYYAWGLNEQGQLGLNNYEPTPTPVKVPFLKGKNIKDVAAGTCFTIVLTQEGQMFGCGQNDVGQLGLGQNFIYKQQQQENEQIQSKLLQNEIQDKMNIQKKQEVAQVKNIEQKIQNKEQKIQQLKQQRKQQQKSPIQQIYKKKQADYYIKSYQKITFQERLDRVVAGSQFTLGWNKDNLYSWGFGSSYVLLTGQEEEQFTPFKVKSKIINQHSIYNIAAGSQHVLYLSYPKNQQKPHVQLSQAAKKLSQQRNLKLSRRKKSPQSKKK